MTWNISTLNVMLSRADGECMFQNQALIVRSTRLSLPPKDQDAVSGGPKTIKHQSNSLQACCNVLLSAKCSKVFGIITDLRS